MTEPVAINTPESETASHGVQQDAREDSKQELFLTALLTGKGMTEACEAAGICRSTGWRWRQDEAFQARYRRAKNELLDGAVAALHSHSLAFVQALADVSSNPQSKDAARATAADRGLCALFRAHELFDVEERLRKLEALALEESK
jgi:hypothetical protein